MSTSVRERLRRLGPPVAAVVVSRVVVLGALYLAPVLRPGYNRHAFFFDWDAAHYLAIAQHGYPPLYPKGGGYIALAAFFPLLPWLSRWLAFVTPLSIKQAGLLISNGSLLAGMIAVWWLVTETTSASEGRGSESPATRTVLLACLWPASFALSMMYSDGLLILFGALCLLLLRRKRWVLAGLAALLAGAARPNGIALLLPCAWCAFFELRRTRSLKPLAAPVLAPLGMLGFFLFLQIRLHDFFLWFKAEKRGWGGGFDFGRHFVIDIVGGALRHPTGRADLVFSAFGGLVGIALFLWAVKERLPAEQLLFAAGALALAIGPAFGASVPRYVLDAFPIFVVPGRRLTERQYTWWVALSAAALAGMTLVSSITRTFTP